MRLWEKVALRDAIYCYLMSAYLKGVLHGHLISRSPSESEQDFRTSVSRLLRKQMSVSRFSPGGG